MLNVRASSERLIAAAQRIVSQPTLRLLKADREFIGSCYGGWWIWPQGLNRDSIVYSVGVGTDVSFDIELIHRFGLTVNAFDPTPRSIQWIEATHLPTQFRFHPVGLADFDGVGVFIPPERKDHVSYSLCEASDVVGTTLGNVQRLGSIARELGHERIDLLKMDIEGEEYAVIDDFSSGCLSVSQLLVEFHGEEPLRRRWRIATAARQLRSVGLVPFSISETGREYSFVNADLTGQCNK
jgi:FkbM family methyltransferase